MEIIATLRRAVASYKASKDAYVQAIRKRDFSSGPRDTFATATNEFVAILTSCCQELVALLPSHYKTAYEGLQFVCKECFEVISRNTADKLPDTTRTYFVYVLQLSDAILPPRDAEIVTRLSSVDGTPTSRSLLLDQLQRSVRKAAAINKISIFFNSFPKMESDIKLLLLVQLQFLMPMGSINEAAILNKIASLYQFKGDLDFALEKHESALAIQQRLAPGSLDEAATLGNIGILFQSKGELDLALEKYESALTIQQRLAPGSLDEAATLGNIGNVFQSKGELDRALRYYESALVITQRLAPESLDEAQTLNNIGNVYQPKGDLDRALQYYESALAIQQRLAPGSLDEAQTLNNIGNVFQSKGELDRALQYYESALAFQQRLAPGSLDEAQTLNNIGNVYQPKGDLDRALRYYESALAIQQRLAPGSLYEAATLDNIGNVFQSKGDLDRALQYYESALAIKQGLAPGSLDTAATLNNIGYVYQSKGDLDFALEKYESALAFKQRLAPGSLDEAATLGNIGNVFQSKGELDLALEKYESALAIQQRLAPGSLDEAATLALEKHESALATTRQLAPGSLDEAATLNVIGNLYESKGDLETALVKYTDICSLEYFKSYSGRDSWILAEARQKQASLYFTLFRVDESIQVLQTVLPSDGIAFMEFIKRRMFSYEFMDCLSHTKFLYMSSHIMPSDTAQLFMSQSKIFLDTQPLLSILYAEEALISATRSVGTVKEIVICLVNAMCKHARAPSCYVVEKLAEKFSIALPAPLINTNNKHPLQTEIDMLKQSFDGLRCQYHKSLSATDKLTYIDENMAGSFFTRFLSLLNKIFRFWIGKDSDKTTELYFLNSSSYKAMKNKFEEFNNPFDFELLNVNLPSLFDILKC
eukprot:gene35745-46376_t